MKIALLAAVLGIIPHLEAAGIAGSLVDATGASVARATVELTSGSSKRQTRTDEAGGYQFSDLPAGEYSLTFLAEAFNRLTVKSIAVVEREEKRIPEITLTLHSCGSPSDLRDFVRLLPSGEPFGVLRGSVLPRAAGVEVLLICRTFHACQSAKTDSDGRFSFDMISAGAYGLSFHRDGFYDRDATEYEYYVNAGFESVYRAVVLEPCANGNCSLKMQIVLPHCE